jgi:hypothetical protein
MQNAALARVHKYHVRDFKKTAMTCSFVDEGGFEYGSFPLVEQDGFFDRGFRRKFAARPQALLRPGLIHSHPGTAQFATLKETNPELPDFVLTLVKFPSAKSNELPVTGVWS